MRSIRRGTTEPISFVTGVDGGLIDTMEVSFSQNNKIVLSKTLGDCAIDGNTVTFELTEEETLKLDCHKNPLAMQVRFKAGGKSLATTTYYMWVLPILKDGCL